VQVAPAAFEIVLEEGRNRQIRKMCKALGYSVVTLHRTRVADIGLQRLRPGEWAELKAREMKVIYKVLADAGEIVR
jgi:23S rRNA pseudouridine2604 synthase